MKSFKYYRNTLVIFGLLVCQFANASNWGLDRNKVVLNIGNKYISDFDVANDGEYPLYVSTSIEEIIVQDGERSGRQVNDAVLIVSPERFVVQPKSRFKVKIMGDVSKIDANSSSYYIHITDSSSLDGVDGVKEKIPMVAGMNLSYGLMVNVDKDGRMLLSESDFTLVKASKDVYQLKNNSGRHVSLISAQDCPSGEADILECPKIQDFSSQSMLPGELSPAFHLRDNKLVVMVAPTIDTNKKSKRLIFQKSE